MARWVNQSKVGLVCPAEHSALVRCFFSLEGREIDGFLMDADVREKLKVPYFADQLFRLAVPGKP